MWKSTKAVLVIRQGNKGLGQVSTTITGSQRLGRYGEVPRLGEMIVELVGNRPAWLVTITHEKQTTHPEFYLLRGLPGIRKKGSA